MPWDGLLRQRPAMLSDIRPGRAFLATAKISCRFAEEEMRLNPSRLPHLLLGEDERKRKATSAMVRELQAEMSL